MSWPRGGTGQLSAGEGSGSPKTREISTQSSEKRSATGTTSEKKKYHAWPTPLNSFSFLFERKTTHGCPRPGPSSSPPGSRSPPGPPSTTKEAGPGHYSGDTAFRDVTRLLNKKVAVCIYHGHKKRKKKKKAMPAIRVSRRDTERNRCFTLDSPAWLLTQRAGRLGIFNPIPGSKAQQDEEVELDFLFLPPLFFFLPPTLAHLEDGWAPPLVCLGAKDPESGGMKRQKGAPKGLFLPFIPPELDCRSQKP